jgi:predicted O-methyltransferase YrrM
MDRRVLDAYPQVRDHPRRGIAPLPLVHPARLSPTGDPLAQTIQARVEQLDTSLFARIESQTTEPDRRSVLALHAAIADRGTFSYLEIGSHLGGSLQVLIADPRCAHITSIENNSTARMLDLLRQVPGADFEKLETLDASTNTLNPNELPAKPDFCFIDWEHTREAALRYARFCLDAIGESGVIAFHDSNVVEPAIHDFVASLSDRQHTAFELPDSVLVIEIGSQTLRHSTFVESARLA